MPRMLSHAFDLVRQHKEQDQLQQHHATRLREMQEILDQKRQSEDARADTQKDLHQHLEQITLVELCESSCHAVALLVLASLFSPVGLALAGAPPEAFPWSNLALGLVSSLVVFRCLQRTPYQDLLIRAVTAENKVEDLSQRLEDALRRLELESRRNTDLMCSMNAKLQHLVDRPAIVSNQYHDNWSYHSDNRSYHSDNRSFHSDNRSYLNDYRSYFTDCSGSYSATYYLKALMPGTSTEQPESSLGQRLLQIEDSP
eukprot:Skav234037  [mRNA]  locus=scaffold5814:34400:35357:- [translate_table: standard]